MYKTQKNGIRCDKKTYRLLENLMPSLKNLYNDTLYIVRQHCFKTREYLRYQSVSHIVKGNENYRLLPSQAARQTVKAIDEAFKSFFGFLKGKKKNLTRKSHFQRICPKMAYILWYFKKIISKCKVVE